MQALIQKGTESNPVWGFVRFTPKGWDIVPNAVRPTVFSDTISLSDIDSLSNNSAGNQEFTLVQINIKIQVP
jgi:hypothetical protein